MIATETMRNIEGVIRRWEDREAKAAIARAKFKEELAQWNAQNHSPIEAVAPAPVTDGERRIIAKLRAENWPYARIAELIGRTEKSCRIIMCNMRARNRPHSPAAR